MKIDPEHRSHRMLPETDDEINTLADLARKRIDEGLRHTGGSRITMLAQARDFLLDIMRAEGYDA